MFANKGRGHTSYLSLTICEELISLMGFKILDTISAVLLISPFSQALQISMSWYRYSSPLLDLLKQRTEFENFHKRVIILCGHDQYNSVLKRVRVPNRRYVDVDDEHSDRNMSPMDKFRQDLFQVFNDQ